MSINHYMRCSSDALLLFTLCWWLSTSVHGQSHSTCLVGYSTYTERALQHSHCTDPRSTMFGVVQVSQKAVTSDTDNWRSSNPSTGATTGAAQTGDAAATNSATNTTSTASSAAARHAAGVPAPGPALGMLRAEDVGRQKWQPAKGLESSVQAQQKLRGILNKLTPDNFDRLLVQVRSLVACACEPSPHVCLGSYSVAQIAKDQGHAWLSNLQILILGCIISMFTILWLTLRLTSIVLGVPSSHAATIEVR